MKRDQRLRAPADFQRTRQLATRAWPHPLLALYVVPNELARTRIGITVSGRVGNAVIRNRVRRRLREAVRARLELLAPGLDVLVVARPASATATWNQLCTAVESVLDRAGATRPALPIVQAQNQHA